MKLSPRTLRSHPLLSLLPSSTIRALAAESSVKEFPKGSVVFNEGEPCTAVYLVLSGRCEARRNGNHGRPEVQQVYGPGDTFGEVELLNAEGYRSTIHVLTRSMLLKIEGALLKSVFVKMPSVAGRVSLKIADQVKFQSRLGGKFAIRSRRTVAVTSLADHVHQRAIAKRLAAAVHNLAGQRVLLLHLTPGSGLPNLRAWCNDEADIGDRWLSSGHLYEHDQGYHELNIHAAFGGECTRAVAPLLGFCSRHFDYVIIDLHPEVPVPTAVEVLTESDLAYVWIEPTMKHLYDFKLLLKQMSDGDERVLSELHPIVCVGDCGVVSDFSQSLNLMGHPVHSFVCGIPLDGASEFVDRGGNFALHTKRLAREIGRCRVGLALSSGASKGLSHIGVIQVLEENGIEIDCVAGSSMGAYVGCVWAHGHGGTGCESIARELETRWGALHLAHPTFPPRSGFLKTGRVIKRLRRTIGESTFADMAIPLRVVATRLDTLERAVFSAGDVARAVEASIAIPGICVPVTIDGETYIDGGVADPLPVDVLREMGIERVIAVNTIPTPERLRQAIDAEREKAVPRPFSIGGFLNRHLNYFANGNVADVMLRALHGAQTRVAEQACSAADVVLRPWTVDSRWYDFTNPRKYITLGRREAEQHLEELKALVAKKPDEPPASQTRLAAAA
jgi:NTE family protein